MSTLRDVTVVFVAGLVTALATGVGALPVFLLDDVSDRWNVALRGLASGIVLPASLFGLVDEGLRYEGHLPGATDLAVGGLVGVALVVLAHGLIDDHEVAPREIADADIRKLAVILGVLTVHSFPASRPSASSRWCRCCSSRREVARARRPGGTAGHSRSAGGVRNVPTWGLSAQRARNAIPRSPMTR